MLSGEDPMAPTLCAMPSDENPLATTLRPMHSCEAPMSPTLCAIPSGEYPAPPTLGVRPSDETVEIMEKAVPALFYTIPKCLLGSAGFDTNNLFCVSIHRMVLSNIKVQ
jgi:hypothetical protein